MKSATIIFFTITASTVAAFDHQYAKYGNLLSEYVADGGVIYERLHSGDNVLGPVRSEFEKVESKAFSAFSEKEQISFLINAYNFYTLDLIVQNLPLKNGIRDIASPWDKKFITLFGKKVSLNHIEHQLLRKKYTEPGIHFALVCASKGCPELLDKPFTAISLNKQLDYAGKRFLMDTTKNRIDGKTLYLSQIFEWYGADFNATHKGGYREYVGNVLGIPIEDYKVKFLPYDWSLNKTTVK